MKLQDIFPTVDQLKLIKGAEADLLKRRQKGMVGFVVGISAAVGQIVLAAVNHDYAGKIGSALQALFHLRVRALFSNPEAIGLLIIVICFGVWFTLRWTSVLAKESKEPFKYTFWIEPFEQIDGTPGDRFQLKAGDRLRLLNHDLMQRMRERIHRLSLLDAGKELSDAARSSLTSHIQVRGSYAVREDKDGKWILQIMARIRIGPPGKPETLAHPVKVLLAEDGPDESQKTLTAAKYNQLLEHVYSRVATEIYKQIQADVKTKSQMFPSSYLRAVAFYYEAVDFERSNTIDAYALAIEFYRESKRYFDIRIFGWLPGILARVNWLPLWRLSKRSLMAEANTRIGFARSLIYRRTVSSFSSRQQYPLFEIPAELNRIISILTTLEGRMDRTFRVRDFQPSKAAEPNALSAGDRYNTLMGFLTHPSDSALKRGRRDFEQLREMLSMAYTVAALAYCYLDARRRAKLFLDSATAANPNFTDASPLWWLARAEAESDVNKKLDFLRRATESDSSFEIAQYRLAQFSEMRMRMRDEIPMERVDSLIEEYDEVLRINPGNIGALSAQGYLLWLAGNLEDAQKKFDEGLQSKAMVRQTFVGDLQYGLARIAAENGDLNRSFTLYTQALSADPAVALHSPTSGLQSKYDYIADGILKRYEMFKAKVDEQLAHATARNKDGETIESHARVSGRTINAVRSYTLNNYGNACLNYYRRFGDPKRLQQAINAFEEAIDCNKDNFVAYYNLNNAYGWRGAGPKKVEDPLKVAIDLAPSWPKLRIDAATAALYQGQAEIKKKREAIERKQKDLIDATLEAIKKERGSRKSWAPSPGATGLEARPSSSGPDSGTSLSRNDQFRSKPIESEVGRTQDIQNLERLQNDLATLNTELRDLEKEIATRRSFLVTTMLSETKWSFALNGPADSDGNGIDQLLGERIERDKLDEGDIRALQVWASALSTNEDSGTALAAALKLCDYVTRYFEENWDTQTVVSGTYRALKNLKNPAVQITAIRDPYEFVAELRSDNWKCLRDKLPPDGKILLNAYTGSRIPQNFLRLALIHQINQIIANEKQVDESCFANQIQTLKNTPESRNGNPEPARLNGKLLRAAFERYLDISGLDAPEDGDHYDTRKKTSDGSLARIIESWLDGDPIHFGSLRWATEFLDVLEPAVQLEYLENAIHRLESDNIYEEVNTDAYYGLRGDVYWRRRDYARAASDYLKATTVNSSEPRYLNALGIAYSTLGDYEQAILPFSKASKLEPKTGVYCWNLARAFTESGKWKDAIAQSKKAIRLDPTNADYHLNLRYVYSAFGNELRGESKFPEALAQYDAAFHESDSIPDREKAGYYSNQAHAYQGLNDWEHAIEACRKALELDPGNVDVARQLTYIHNAEGIEYANKGEFRKAIEKYKEALNEPAESPASDTAVYYSNLASAYQDLREWQSAIEALQKAIEFDPNNTAYVHRLHNTAGNDCVDKGRFAEAVEHYQKAIEADPENSTYRSNLALTYRDLENWSQAVQAWNEAIKTDPNNASYRHQLTNALGEEYAGKNDFVNALKCYQTAAAADPQNSLYLSNMAIAYQDLKFWDDAIDAWKKVLAIDPTNKFAQWQLSNTQGVLCFEKGDFERAIDYYKQSMNFNDKIDVTTYANLALAWEGLIPKLGKEAIVAAILAIKKALTVAPENIAYHETLNELEKELEKVRATGDSKMA